MQAPRELADVVPCQLHHSEMGAAGGSGRQGWLTETKRKAEEGATGQKTWWLQDREGLRIGAEET